MSADHEHEPLELPAHVRAAVEAGAEALAPSIQGCLECARLLAARVVLAALPELERPAPAPNGHAAAPRARRRRWRT